MDAPISRTLQVVDCTCLEALNDLICILFGWEKNNEYDFLTYERTDRYLVQELITLRQLELSEGERFEYIYDAYKSYRIHTIELISIQPLGTPLDEFCPYCLNAFGSNSGQDGELPIQQLIELNHNIRQYWMELEPWMKYEYDDDDDEYDVFFDGGFPLSFPPIPLCSIATSSKPRKPKVKDRKVPNYAYKPRGKKPYTYFKKKIDNILDWPVRDVNDLNYAIRIFEGWTAQAQKYLDQREYMYANFICGLVLWNGIHLYQWYSKEFEKQQPRIKKFIRQACDILMPTLQHDSANWRKVQLEDFRKLKGHDMDIFHVKGGIDMDDAIQKVEEMMKESKTL